MTFIERFRSICAGGQPSQMPNVEIGYFDATIARWQTEGLPSDLPPKPPADDLRYTRHSRELTEYFGLDAHDIIPVMQGVNVGMIPAPEIVHEEREGDTVTRTYSHGLVRQSIRGNEDVSIDLRPPVGEPADWERIRGYWDAHAPGRLAPDESEVWRVYRERDFPIRWRIPGFFWLLRELIGIEKTCLAIYDQPELIEDILEFWTCYLLDVGRRMLQHVVPDMVCFNEDLSGRNGPLISPRDIARLFGDRYRRLNDMLESAGVGLRYIDSDGLVDSVVPVFIESGINGIGPWEIQAGTDPLGVARANPDLFLVGAVNKLQLAKDRAAIDAELARRVAPLLERSRYLPCVDHLAHEDIPLDNYRYYMEQKARLLERG